MNKVLLAILAFIVPSICFSQKIDKCNYKNVDTVIQYRDAEIIIYRDISGKPHSDTIYYSRMKCDINIDHVDEVIINQDKKLKRNGK